MEETIDRKFKFVAVNPCNNHVYTEKNAFIICAKDAAALDALDAYILKCKILGADDMSLESISLLMERVRDFQGKHGYKLADTTGDCELNRCIGGILD